jgi:type III pantothenate kinase
MLLALDAGNTNITIGTFEESKLTHRWRLRRSWADRGRVGYPAAQPVRLKARHAQVGGVIISALFPVESTLAAMSRRYFSRDPMFVTLRRTPAAVAYDNPREVGADRLVNGVALFKCSPCAVVDLRLRLRLTLFQECQYLGGIICPRSASPLLLFQRTARCRIDFRRRKPIGTNTVRSKSPGSTSARSQ